MRWRRNWSKACPDASSTIRPTCRSRLPDCSSTAYPVETPAELRPTAVCSPPASLWVSVRSLRLPGADGTTHQARSVRQKIPNCDFAICRNGVELELRRPSGRRGLAAIHRYGDFQTFKFRDEPGHGIVQSNFAFFHQHHDGHAHNGLRHGSEAEDRVLRHWLF